MIGNIATSAPARTCSSNIRNQARPCVDALGQRSIRDVQSLGQPAAQDGRDDGIVDAGAVDARALGEHDGESVASMASIAGRASGRSIAVPEPASMAAKSVQAFAMSGAHSAATSSSTTMSRTGCDRGRSAMNGTSGSISAALRARMPMVSSDGASGIAPRVERRHR